MSAPPSPRRRLALSFATGLVAAFAFTRCGAEGTPAPALDPKDVPPPSECRSLEGYMPEFFKLLRDPTKPLAGLREVVERLSTGADVRGDPLGRVLSSTIHGLKWYTHDPFEVREGDEAQRCYPVTPQNPLPEAWGGRLCEVDVPSTEQCENRMCTMKRAIDFGIRDRAARDALLALRPMINKVLGYASNSGPGADGKEHFEPFEVLALTSADEAACPPDKLIQVTDRLITYFRNDASCAKAGTCVGQRALKVLKDLLADPQLQAFLNSYQDANQAGSGSRKAFITLANVVADSVVVTPEGQEFDAIQQQLDTLLYPFLERDERFEQLQTKIEAAVVLIKGLLAPEVGMIQPLKTVLNCISLHDGGKAAAKGLQNGRLVGMLYDLLSRSGPQGLDLVELTDAVDRVVNLDEEGVLAGALHSVLASMLKDKPSMEALRVLLHQVLTVENARLAIPTLKVMVEKDILGELVVVVDNLAFGCRREAP